MSRKIREAARHKEMGVYSGRGTGIPVAGAIGVDRSSHLGDPPRPHYIGNSGSPSASADVSHSLRVGSVNRGYEEDIDQMYTVMFPDQVDEENIDDEENIYYMYDDTPLKTRKLHHLSRTLSPGEQYIKKLSNVRESRMSRKKYSLTPLFNESYAGRLDEFADLPWADEIDFTDAGNFLQDVIDLPADAIEEFLGPVADVIKPVLQSLGDVAGDVVAGFLAIPPFVGDAIALSLAAYNIGQLQETLAEADVAIIRFKESPSDAGRNLLVQLLDDLTRDLVDLMQRLLEAVPDPGVSEATSMMASLVQNGNRLRGYLSRLGFRYAGNRASFGTHIKEKAQMALVVKPALRIITGLMASDYVPPTLERNSTSILRVPQVMAELYDLITIWDAHGVITDELGERTMTAELEQMDMPQIDVPEYLPTDIVSAKGSDLLPTDIVRRGASGSDMDDLPMAAESAIIRDFIREALLSEYAQRYTVNLNGPNPAGYLSYEPEELGEQPEKFSDDNITDFNLSSVLYPSSGGYVRYNPKPVNESAIKEYIKQILREQEEEDDLDEFAGSYSSSLGGKRGEEELDEISEEYYSEMMQDRDNPMSVPGEDIYLDEYSVAGSVAGYTGPMSSAAGSKSYKKK